MRVLVVEDDAKLARFLVRVLVEEGFVADTCPEGERAIALAVAGRYDLFILDRMLPDIDGLEVCRKLRQSGVVAPVLMLTALGEVQERVLGLRTGADDYLVKPFELDELLARVEALVRRSAGLSKLTIGTIEVDRTKREVRLGGARLELTVREYSLFLDLVLHAGHTVSRGELLERVWGTPFDPGSNLVEVHMSRLRDKLGAAAQMIETVRGAGYRLNPPGPGAGVPAS